MNDELVVDEVQEENKLDRIDINKVNIIINEGEFVIPYGIKYKMVVKQPDDALSKMYDEKNEMIVNLRVPTNEYKDEDLQELIKWSTLSNLDEGYFRNLAIYMRMNDKMERTIVFTHAYIRMNKKINTKADYVDIELIVNQRGDKFVGVGFGQRLEDTLRKTKERVESPPRINVILPVANENDVVEGWGDKVKYKYGIKYFLNSVYISTDDDIFDGLNKRDEQIQKIIKRGYRWKQLTNDTNSEVTKKANLIGYGKETTETNYVGYNLSTCKIIVKDSAGDYEYDNQYVDENGSSCTTLPITICNLAGYRCVENSTTYTITKDNKSHTINKAKAGNVNLRHIKMRDLADAIIDDTGGADPLTWDTGTRTVTLVIKDEISEAVNNLLNDTNLNLNNKKSITLSIITEVLLKNKYELCFVAGVLANVEHEGGVAGQFESSAYRDTDARPDYLWYMVNNHSYGTLYSGKNITDIAFNDLLQLTSTLNNENTPRGNYFGLGSVQWTHKERFNELINEYNKNIGNKVTFTLEELAKIEAEFIIMELEGVTTYKYYAGTYQDWLNSLNSRMTESEKAEKAGRVISNNYVQPYDPDGKQEDDRAAGAIQFYSVLKGI